MKTTIEPKGLEVKVGRTELIAEHNGGKLTFIHPPYGPDTFLNVRNQVVQNGLVMPDTSETASLLYAAWQNPEERYSKEILQILKERYLWANNGLLWTPKGVFVEYNPQFKDQILIMNRNELERRLSSNDPTVKFIEPGFKLGEQTPSELETNRLILALAGEEGAEKLAEMSGRYKIKKPYVYGIDKPNEDIARLVALDSVYVGYRLGVGGSSHGYYRYGYVFGVSKTGEASSRKN